ncbi:HU family DNA-binding protein [Mycoplasma zalophi]|uniref:HU family DNA-binding protein n=1 Tax=Mycoplasma zalophi TaxID=191287 RepID=A0ABS6DQ47_9MOLU|nr:HU family DNA-binding protein [Mycoplasma zalophi]MBU4690745.1 HU family DNA-binding protein [Mycoplasma zalophi]MBU4692439.1 HU family DNA-binding protein [Mycoplasma zalophi]
MNKKQLLQETSKRLNLNYQEVVNIYDAIEEIILEGLKKHEKISISGFGTFTTQFKDQKETINKFSQKPLTVQAKYEPKFKFSKVVKQKIN